MSANKAKLVIVKNPFQPWSERIVKDIPAGVKLRDELVGEANIGCDIYTNVNGKTVSVDDYEVVGNEIITVSPVVGKGGGGKQILGLIAMVGLAIATQGIVNAGVGTGFWAAGHAGAYLAAATATIVGGTLINKAFYSVPSTKDTRSESTYSWGGVQTMEGQNNPIQLTYGKVLSAGQTIAKFVQNIDNKEYLNWLLACGEGELEFSNILINDNPVDYYNGMELETRAGTNDQEIIKHFNDTYFTKSLGYQLNDDDVRTDTAQGTGTEGLIVKIEFSTGLYYSDDKGKLKNAWVELKIEYRLKGGEWQTLTETRITDNKSSAIRKEFRIDNLTPGEYEVRCQVTGRSHDVNNTRASVRCYWSALTSIVYDDFIYPNIALIGIRALATDQISGSPTIKFIKERKNVWVYNPEAEQYEQRPANNPAWACYDLLHQASRLKNINTNEYEFDVRGVPAHSLIYEQFNEWANFCEDKKYYVNIEITTIGEMLNIINENVATIGHGTVVRFGTRYGCVWYCKKQPVQMFGMGNIVAGSFKEDFLETSSRANCVEITYTDADHEYNREVITIYGDNYDSDATENATQVTFNGITSYDQAFREGKYQLYSNKYQLRTVSFECNVDAIACTIGDVVLVAHDVPQWSYSGRVYDVDVDTGTFRLPVELSSMNGDIRLMYRTVNDNLYTINVSVVENSDGWCTVQGNITNKVDAPQKGDIFDIGLVSTGSKPFIVTNITRAQDFTRNITGVEYIESIYDENYDIPPINYSETQNGKAENVYNLNASCYKYLDDAGNFEYHLSASWECNKNCTYSVYVSKDNVDWTLVATRIKDTSIDTDVNGSYAYIKVISHYDLNISSGVVAEIEKLNYTLVPNVRNLIAYNKYREFEDDIVRYDIHIEWDMPLDYSEYLQSQIWYKTSNTQVTNIGVISDGMAINDIGYRSDWIFGGQGYNSAVLQQAIAGDKYKIAVCVQDGDGKYQTPDDAEQVEILVARKSETPNTPNNLSVSITDTFNISWDEVRNADIRYYEIRTNKNIGVVDYGYIGRTTESKFSTDLIREREGVVYVYAVSVYAVASAPAILNYNYPKLLAPNLQVKAKVLGIQCITDSIPKNCIGVHWYFEGGSHIVDVVTQNETYYHSCEPDVYEVYAHYYDYFGDGLKSEQITVTVETYINPALIKESSITADKLNESTQIALHQATTSMQQAEMGDWWRDKLRTDIEGVYANTSYVDSKITDVLENISEGEISAVIQEKTAEYVSMEIAKISGEGGLLNDYYKKTETAQYVSSQLANYSTTANTTSLVNQKADSINTIVARLSKMASSETFNNVVKQSATPTINNILSFSANTTTMMFYINVTPQDVYTISLYGGNSSTWNVFFTDASNKVICNGCGGLNYKGTSGKNGDNNGLATSTGTANWTKISDNVTVPNISTIKRMWLRTRCDSTSVVADVSLWASVQKTVYSAITQLTDGIQLSVTGTTGNSSINLSQGTIALNTNLLQVGRAGALTSIADSTITTGMLKAGAVTADKMQVSSLSSLTATIGTLRTKTSGARVEITDNLIKVYDNNNVLRVRLGVW